MIYFLVLALVALNAFQLWLGSRERSKLQDAVIALSNKPEALTMLSEGPPIKPITFVDETRMAELDRMVD